MVVGGKVGNILQMLHVDEQLIFFRELYGLPNEIFFVPQRASEGHRKAWHVRVPRIGFSAKKGKKINILMYLNTIKK